MNTVQNIEKQGGWSSSLFMMQPSQDQLRRGAVFMPLKLRTALVKNGIQQSELSNAIRQPAKIEGEIGKPLSSSATSLLLRWGKWPKTTSKKSIKAQTELFLKSRGIDDVVIKTIWEEELNNEDRKGTASKKPRNASLDGNNIAGLDASFLMEATTPEATMLSQEAQTHFNLRKNPFKYDMNGVDDVFMSVGNREVLMAMYQAARFGGLIAVPAESGAGKTSIHVALIDKIEKENAKSEVGKILVIEPLIFDKSKSTPNSLAEAIITQVNPETKIPVSSEGKARAVLEVLTKSAEAGNKHVLIQEEAHKHEASIFPFYKQFWEMSVGFKKLLGIILIGQPKLKYHLSLNHNWESREFINRCEVAEMMPLDAALEQYLKFKFERVGADVNNVIEADAYDCLREVMFHYDTQTKQYHSTLHPLFVNNRIIQSMNLAAEIGMDKVNADVIKRVKL